MLQYSVYYCVYHVSDYYLCIYYCVFIYYCVYHVSGTLLPPAPMTGINTSTNAIHAEPAPPPPPISPTPVHYTYQLSGLIILV